MSPSRPFIAPDTTGALTEDHLSWLADRGISLEAAKRRGCYSSKMYSRAHGYEVPALAFPYHTTDQLDRKARKVGVKYRSTDGKEFSQEPGSEQILWGLELLDGSPTVVICEGEMDALALDTAGVANALSVPGGAPSKEVARSDDKKFAFLRGVWQLDRVKQFILAVDADGPGQVLRSELTRRIGAARVWLVQWPEGCKDANDVLLKHGATVLADCIRDATPAPVQALYTADHYTDRVMGLYDKGRPTAESTGYQKVDRLFKIAPGQLSIVTGIPGSGKSTFIDQIMVNMARAKDWTFGVCSFEFPPEFHVARLCEMYRKERFTDHGYGPPVGARRMTREQAAEAMEWVKEHFFFIDFPESDALPTLDNLLERAQAAVLRWDIKGLVIDPYNYIQMDKNHETEAVSQMLSRVHQFSKGSGVHTWFVAHPTKLQASPGGGYPVPKGYDISGSAAWFSKADIGVTVHRVPESTQAEIHCWKAKFSWIGAVGTAVLDYDPSAGVYSECIESEREPVKVDWEAEEKQLGELLGQGVGDG
jgi:twinkle protein